MFTEPQAQPRRQEPVPLAVEFDCRPISKRLAQEAKCFLSLRWNYLGYRSGGFSWLRPKDTVSDWWRVARLYGARKGVDRFFRVNYPAAFASSHGLAISLRGLLHRYFGWLNSPVRRRLRAAATQGPVFDFGRRVARRVFPKKRPAWFGSAAVIFMVVDGLIVKFDGRRSKSEKPNRDRGLPGHKSSDSSAVPPEKVKIPNRVE